MGPFSGILSTGSGLSMSSLIGVLLKRDILQLLEQWFNSDPYSRTEITEGLCIPEDGDLSKEVNEESTRLFKEYNVMGTSTFFINGYKLPNQYDIDDIKYFRELFKEKEEVLMGKDTVK